MCVPMRRNEESLIFDFRKVCFKRLRSLPGMRHPVRRRTGCLVSLR